VPRKICVLGEGAWGTAIATLLTDNGHEVNMWCHDIDVAHSIKISRSNKYVPNLKISSKIIPFTHIKDALEEVDYIFEAIPVKFLREVVVQSKPFFKDNHVWVILSKGIESDTLMLPSQILDDVFGIYVKKAVISGPSFAKDLISKDLTAVDLACGDEAVQKKIIEILSNNYFKIFSCKDLMSVQFCGALKNVVSIIVGMADGFGYDDNCKAYLAVLGLKEISGIIQEFRGDKNIVYGLAGVGDLILSSFGKSGRNFLIGKEIGQGNKLDNILSEAKIMPEGINTIKSVYQIIKKYDLNLPLFSNIYKVIFEQLSCEQFFRLI